MNVCKHCGTEMKDVLATCPSCGERGAVLYNYTVPVEKAADARKNMMSKWLKFDGRCRRNEFWKAALLNTFYILGLVALLVAIAWIMWTPTIDGLKAKATSANMDFADMDIWAKMKLMTDMDYCSFIFMICATILISIYLFRITVAQIAMTVRRLHDLGQSGLLLLLSMIPSVIYLVMNIWVLFIDSTLVFSGGFNAILSFVGPFALVTNVILFVVLLLDSWPGNNAYGTNPKDIYIKKKEQKKSWA